MTHTATCFWPCVCVQQAPTILLFREREWNLAIHVAIFRSTTVGDFSSCLLSTVRDVKRGVTTRSGSTVMSQSQKKEDFNHICSVSLFFVQVRNLCWMWSVCFNTDVFYGTTTHWYCYDKQQSDPDLTCTSILSSSVVVKIQTFLPRCFAFF